MRSPTRPVFAFVLVATALAACQSAPAPKPEPAAAPAPPPPPPPAPKADPLTLGTITVEKQTLVEATLSVPLTLGPDNAGTEAKWKAAFGDTTLGEGTIALALDADRKATIELPVEFGRTVEALAPYQGSQVTEIALSIDVGGHVETRAVRARSPLLPTFGMLSVQASRESVSALAVTYLFQVKNPNPFEVRAGTLEYEAVIAGKSVAKTDLPLASKVPASSNVEYEIPAQANTENCGKEFQSIVKQSSVPWTFTGSVSIQGVRLPVKLSGDMKLSQ